MPTYEYRCPDGHDFEKFVLKISDAKAELACPTCGKPAGRRVSAGGGLLFKGSGFYITDYGKDGKKDQRAASSKGESAAKTDSAAPAPAPTAPGTPTPASASTSPAPKSGPAT